MAAILRRWRFVVGVVLGFLVVTYLANALLDAMGQSGESRRLPAQAMQDAANELRLIGEEQFAADSGLYSCRVYEVRGSMFVVVHGAVYRNQGHLVVTPLIPAESNR